MFNANFIQIINVLKKRLVRKANFVSNKKERKDLNKADIFLEIVHELLVSKFSSCQSQTTAIKSPKFKQK